MATECLVNHYLVAVRGDRTVIMRPPSGVGMDKDDALALVAWVSVLAGLTDAEVIEAKQTVESA